MPHLFPFELLTFFILPINTLHTWPHHGNVTLVPHPALSGKLRLGLTDKIKCHLMQKYSHESM